MKKPALLMSLVWLLSCSPEALEALEAQETAPPVFQLSFAESGDAAFDAWRNDFAQRALKAGRHADSIHKTLSGLSLHPKALEADKNQPEFVRPIWDYVRIATRTRRIESGRRRLQEGAPFLDVIADTYGVPAEILGAIWGMETNYGGYLGSYDGPRVLASMASHGRRKHLGEAQLLAIMHLLEQGLVTRAQLAQASWAGAMGHTQFMPTSFVTHAVDWDRDGKQDLWKSEPDALASTANYLLRAGWKRDTPWLAEARLPDDFDYTLADGQSRSLEVWHGLGVEAIMTQRLARPQHKAELFVPGGANGPIFLLFQNFKALKSYNNSDSYALSVSLLAHELAGRGGVQQSWPTEAAMLTIAQVQQMQEYLEQLGYRPGKIDGRAGRHTRKALARFQKTQGLRADGFPTEKLLAQLASKVAGKVQ